MSHFAIKLVCCALLMSIAPAQQVVNAQESSGVHQGQVAFPSSDQFSEEDGEPSLELKDDIVSESQYGLGWLEPRMFEDQVLAANSSVVKDDKTWFIYLFHSFCNTYLC